MAASSKGKKFTFEIDDSQSVDENIATFVEKLSIADSQLGPVLSPSLAALSNEVPVDPTTLLDLLYDGTAPATEGKGEGAAS